MSNLSPDFTLPINFALIRRMPGPFRPVFYTDSQAF